MQIDLINESQVRAVNSKAGNFLFFQESATSIGGRPARTSRHNSSCRLKPGAVRVPYPPNTKCLPQKLYPAISLKMGAGDAQMLVFISVKTPLRHRTPMMILKAFE